MQRHTLIAAVIAGTVLAVPAVLLTTRDAAPAAVGEARGDADHAAVASDALLRRARVESNPAHALLAERVVRAALDRDPGDYQATRMLAAVLLAQHRFGEALAASDRARAIRPDDAWNDGTSGDAWVELGEYDKAFEAYDRMAARKPNAASYARIAHARELQGDLEGAAGAMRMAAAATAPSDTEALAWHAAQLGTLLLRLGRHGDAEREFRRADHHVARHPYARAGMTRLLAARGRYREALALVQEDLAAAPTPELAAWAGDLWMRLGDRRRARDSYDRMETLEREGWAAEEPQPAALARLLAERSLKPADAWTLAEQAVRLRRDIYTMDARAWAAFRVGHLDVAAAAARDALRTGTRDQRILAHAAAIALATGDRASAATHAARAAAGGPFDLIAFDEARRVLAALANPDGPARRRPSGARP